MRRSRASLARPAYQSPFEIVPESFRIERDPDLRAIKHCYHIRGDPAVCACDRRTTRTPTPEVDRVRNAEEPATRQSVYRLEPERRPQNDCRCVFAEGET